MYSTAPTDWAVRSDSVDLGAMAVKCYSTLPRGPELEPHHQVIYIYIQTTRCGKSHFAAEIFGVSLNSSLLGWEHLVRIGQQVILTKHYTI